MPKHKKDPRIEQLVNQRWSQYEAILQSVTSAEAFIVGVSQLLTSWYHTDAPRVFASADDEPRTQWLLLQRDLHKLQHSPNPDALLQTEVAGEMGSKRRHGQC